MSVHDEVCTFLESLDIGLPEDWDSQTNLFDTGLLDSLALFNLTLWIERRMGRPIEPAKFEVRREWATAGDIVQFIEGRPTQDSMADGHRQTLVSRRTSGDDHVVLKYSPDYKIQLAELQKELWSPDIDLNIRFFEWKYESNPYSTGAPLIYLAFQRGELVGMRGFCESRWQAGSQIETVLVADDLVIRNGHRNRGLFTRIMDAAFADLAERNYTYVFNLSASPTNVFGSLTMGWKSVGALEPMGTPPQGSRLRTGLRSIFRKSPVLWRFAEAPALYSSSEKMPFKVFDATISRRSKEKKSDMTFDTEPRLCEMEAFINRNSHDGRIRQLRDHEYLRWRYKNPLSEYRFVYADGERLDGYAAISRSIAGHPPSGRATVVDIEASDDDVFIEMLRAAASSVDGLYFWTATMNESRQRKLRDLGFAPADLERASRGYPCILVRQLSERGGWHIDKQPLLDMTAWDVRALYSMST